MTPNESKIDPLLMRKLFLFDEKSGHYFFRPRPLSFFKNQRGQLYWHSHYLGTRAFTAYDVDGYNKIFLLGSYHRVHRIIWAYHYGKWPTNQIDHINGVRDDNRIENLRDVTPLDNARNRKRMILNTSGVTGVIWLPAKNKWRANIKVKGRLLSLGHYDSKSEAIDRRKQAEVQYGFHPNHGRKNPASKELS